MWEGSFSLKSESGHEQLVKWWEGCSVMSDQGIRPPSLWYPVTYLNYTEFRSADREDIRLTVNIYCCRIAFWQFNQRSNTFLDSCGYCSSSYSSCSWLSASSVISWSPIQSVESFCYIAGLTHIKLVPQINNIILSFPMFPVGSKEVKAFCFISSRQSVDQWRHHHLNLLCIGLLSVFIGICCKHY